MTDDQEHFDDPALDALLAQATWPEPTPAGTRRLADFYRTQRATGIGRRYLLAASLLIACAIAAFLVVRAGSSPTPVAIKPPPPPLNSGPAEDTSHPLIEGRAPTSVELARLVVVERDVHRAKPEPKPDEPNIIDRAVALISNNESPQSLSNAAGLLGDTDRSRVRRDLFTIVVSPDRAKSRAAARLIAATADADAVPLLLQMDARPQFRDAAVTGLARVAWPALLAELFRSHPQPDHRKQLAAALLRAPAGTSVYLDLVADPATSRDALAALDAVSSPATEPFFYALRDPRVSIRLAAAKVLGRIDGPVTTARLVELTQRSDCRREALIALADSRGPEAKQFLQEARRGGPLAGAVRSILIDPSITN